jgi:hypothetical protein
MILTQSSLCSFPATATMVGSTGEIEDFTTPDRKPPHSSTDQEEKKEVLATEAARDSKPGTVTPAESSATRDPVTVTPAESSATRDTVKSEPSALQLASSVESPDERHVRFDNGFDNEMSDEGTESHADSKSRRGAVSRRGGRCGSPGRAGNNSTTKKESTVLEFKTYRSPPRTKREETDTVPSLCSTSSVDKDKEGAAKAAKAGDAEVSNSKGNKKPSSISCDASMNQTSPLADGSEQPAEAKESKIKAEKMESKKNNVTFSPVPPARDHAIVRVSRKHVLWES